MKSLKRDVLPKVLDSSSSSLSISLAEDADDDNDTDNATTSTAEFIQAAQELAREAYLLSRLDHSHIISIKGWTMGGVSSYQQYKRHDAFFLLLELLEKENLEDRIARWNHEDSNDVSASQQHERKVEQLTISSQVATALEYIHSMNVVFRELKPQNIGFGRTSCSIQEKSGGEKIHVKLMDFGLAHELPTSISCSNRGRTTIVPNQEEEQQNNNKKRNMLFDVTGMVGTTRYMSPEVYLNQPYGVEADIYSWSIVSYEIFSKICPYNNMTSDRKYYTFIYTFLSLLFVITRNVLSFIYDEVLVYLFA